MVTCTHTQTSPPPLLPWVWALAVCTRVTEPSHARCSTEGWQLFAAGGLTLLTALADPLLRAAMVACVLPADGGALQGALSTGLLLTMRGAYPTASDGRCAAISARKGCV